MSVISRRALLGGAAAATTAGPAFAAWPERPIRLVVPFGAGGPLDALARLMAPLMSEDLGQSAVVDNRTGAGGVIGSAEVARAAPDGHTALMSGVNLPVITLVQRDPPYRMSDFAPLSRLAVIPHVVVVPAALPVSDMAGFVAYAKANPGRLSFASFGVTTSNHFAGELLNLQAGLDLTHVPYRGGAAAIADLLAGRVTCMFSTLPDALPFLREGRLKALGAVYGERLRWLPDLPTLAEQGMPGIVSESAFGLLVPAATPAAIQQRLGDSARRTLADPQLRGRLEQLGLIPVGSTGPEFAALIERDIRLYADVIRRTGITSLN
ncbi:tripartite tricarboxylate transporter substrate binding protein [Roseococcus sp. SYP-B2431]|uniref:Bug family tripartite tricarboxylate transporter substrate binding protein n=1 Tax=Roseococcus sp. SYP-B2431 TaxID=2496640 RepID=UPI00103F6932|nr:tripartite tricarboxylate transporter substrate binding protein [Roseococcus sp. SYP-B2431]TCH98105.1 tripartite tricarboxylate transporter substrate binding protein [Roseococcus sp. SYP-B2431]